MFKKLRVLLIGLALLPAMASAQFEKNDEPELGSFQLPLPNPAFPNCPAGYFIATAEDGPELGLSPGTFGMEVRLTPPGTLRLEGGLNFGALLDDTQAAFAGFNIQNPANESQRLTIRLTGRTPFATALPVRIQVVRDPAGANQLVYESFALLTLNQPVSQSIIVAPAFHAVNIRPEFGPSLAGGAADGEVFVELGTQFVDRPGGGFFAGAVVGGYHAAHPFGAPQSGFLAFCLGTQHTAIARLYSTPTYSSGARDLRLRLFDYLRNDITPRADAPTTVQTSLQVNNTLQTPLYAPTLNGVSFPTIAAGQTVDLDYSGPSRGTLSFGVVTDPFNTPTRMQLSNELVLVNGVTEVIGVYHDNLSTFVSQGSLSANAPVVLYAPTIVQNNPSPVQARIFNGLQGLNGGEDAVAIPGSSGAVVVTNRTLAGDPRVYFAIRAGQNAHVRVIQNSSGRGVDVFDQSFTQLSNALRGEVTVTVSPDVFGP